MNSEFKRPIVKSLLDQDNYKISMQNFVALKYPNEIVEYKFKNRGNHKFNMDFFEAFHYQIVNNFPKLVLTNDEYEWLADTCLYLDTIYLKILKNYRFNPKQIHCSLGDGILHLSIYGSWLDTILWEVPLMATISELYFKICDTTWKTDYWQNEQARRIYGKARMLKGNGCNYAEFGTRRRRSFETQNIILNQLKDFDNCVGTSNLYFAKKYNIKPIGTMAHELIQAMSAIESLNHPNFQTLCEWSDLYDGELGIALTDTFTTDAFLADFSKGFAKLYDGVRQDSGDPYQFTDKIINHYKNLGINPMTKTIIFSDSLNILKCANIKNYCEGKIKCSFGIGTNFTNDFNNSPALNMVIKLYKVNGFPVVKLSDDKGKENGEPQAVENMKWILRNQDINI